MEVGLRLSPLFLSWSTTHYHPKGQTYEAKRAAEKYGYWRLPFPKMQPNVLARQTCYRGTS